jgi:hypothetical protein
MMTMTTRGSPRARGRCHGQQAASLVGQVRDLYARKGMLEEDPLPLLHTLEAAYPEMAEEMEGIAEGAGLPKDQVFRVNLQRLHAAPACSIAGIRDRAGNPWIAKTDDIGEDELGLNILCRGIPDSGPGTLALRFAGTLWTSAGTNDRGFCLAVTRLEDGAGPVGGLPPMLLLAALVERCATVAEAVDFLERHDLDFGGFSLLLADASKNMVLLEKNTQGQCLRPLAAAEDAVLVHTNHACLGRLCDPSGFAETALGRNSRTRLARLYTRLAELPRDREGLMSLLRDHDPIGGICQHGGSGLHTDYGIVFSPCDAGAWVAGGAPCRIPFEFFPPPPGLDEGDGGYPQKRTVTIERSPR